VRGGRSTKRGGVGSSVGVSWRIQNGPDPEECKGAGERRVGNEKKDDTPLKGLGEREGTNAAGGKCSKEMFSGNYQSSGKVEGEGIVKKKRGGRGRVRRGLAEK